MGGDTMVQNEFKKESRSTKLHELLRRDKDSLINSTEEKLSTENYAERFSVPKEEAKPPYESPYNVNSHII